ncbi:KH domain-containing protein, partial [Pseudomonas aeruginosa]
HALILVEREGQKKIIIGDKGERIKSIGQNARKDMEVLFDSKVMLNLWVLLPLALHQDQRMDMQDATFLLELLDLHGDQVGKLGAELA